MKRCEITLPLGYNNGDQIEAEKFYVTKQELVDKFGGISINRHWSGSWRSKGKVYNDSNVLFQINIPDEEVPFMKEYKKVLEERFQQIEIQIVFIDISVL